MKEDLLHYVWRLKKFDLTELRTTSGEPVIIHRFGTLNTDGGPDFLNARISISGTEWAGNVEMHLKSSDWNRHGHDKDAAYKNVILHVVFEEDEPIYRNKDEKIPCLELKNKIDPRLQTQYLFFIHNEKRIPCEGATSSVARFTWRLWLERLAIERLEEKIIPIEQELERTNNDREEVFYRFLARSFGMKTNKEPFEHLARSLPLKVLSKHRGNLFQVEALLFGQSGLLERDFEDEYPNSLKKEYTFLRKKFGLNPIHSVEWKFLRMRPANFPTVRIAQFAQLIHKTQRIFGRLLWVNDAKQLEDLFRVGVSEYWKTHYVFDKFSKKREKNLGMSAIQLITINTLAPFLFQYGKEKKEQAFVDRGLKLLEYTPAERNRIISMWNELGVEADNAFQTQALLHLKHQYCDKQKCLNCKIGHAILGK